MEKDNPESNVSNVRRIAARSRRQVMDWSLALASQGIESTPDQDEAGWGLTVAAHDYDRARQTIQLYRTENRGWNWRHKLPGSQLLFHWGGLVWCFVIVWIYAWSSHRMGALEHSALMDNRAVAAGQWWRVFTAMTLHADVGHLMANATTGFILLGLAMARYGVGLALLAAYLGGAMGNVAGFILYEEQHRGLGASGMVMAALGLLATQGFAGGWKSPFLVAILFRGLMAGTLMLILMGTAPGSDVLAHVGGFVGGAVLGVLLNLLPLKFRENQPVNIVALLLLVVCVLATWWLAWR